MATAVLVDGGFFVKRLRYLRSDSVSPAEAADHIVTASRNHLRVRNGRSRQLYRIFYYDCPPLSHRVENPISKKGISLDKTQVAVWRNSLFDELRMRRKVALRLGYLNQDTARWVLREKTLKRLLRNEISLSDLTEGDVKLDADQKGVDIRIGIDIASMALKGQIDQLILVTGDSDFVPAAKLARREGVDVILDPMGQKIRDDLFTHIDGLHQHFGRFPKDEAEKVERSE